MARRGIASQPVVAPEMWHGRLRQQLGLERQGRARVLKLLLHANTVLNTLHVQDQYKW